MAVELLPSILATTASQLVSRATLAQRLARIVHLDIMDGKFVTTKSVGLSAIQKISWSSRVEVHAMVQDPTAILKLLDIVRPVRVYVPVELGDSLFPFIAVLRSRRIEVGLAINPKTPASAVGPYAHLAKSILVLAVQPGNYQATLWPSAFQRIRDFHRRWPKKTIVCDGSMNKKTIVRVIKAGAKRIIVGSDVMLSDAPDLEWRTLQQLTKS